MKQLMLTDNPAGELRRMIVDGTLRDFEPAVADLFMNIPKGFHHKDNLDHSIKVLENAIARETNGPDLILRTAALLHDMGKPATRKLGTKKSVSFDGHEAVGANMAKKVLSRHGYSKNEIKEISLIIRLHMRSHGFDEGDWTDSGVRRLMNDAGSEATLQRLVIVFYADATTANMNKLRAHHASIDKLRSEIERVREVDERKALRPALNGNEVMEMFNLKPGRELGAIMKFLNSDEGIVLSKDEAIELIREKF